MHGVCYVCGTSRIRATRRARYRHARWARRRTESDTEDSSPRRYRRLSGRTGFRQRSSCMSATCGRLFAAAIRQEPDRLTVSARRERGRESATGTVAAAFAAADRERIPKKAALARLRLEPTRHVERHLISPELPAGSACSSLGSSCHEIRWKLGSTVMIRGGQECPGASSSVQSSSAAGLNSAASCCWMLAGTGS